MANIYEAIKYFKTIDGVEIEYADLEGDGPTLLFIPGYSLATDLVLPALSKLQDQFRVITLTLRGFGGANPTKAKGTPAEGEVSLSQAARDVKALIDYLNLDECIVMGYSMGTHVAFSYIEQFGCDRISKLIILDMTPKLINDETWNLGLYQGHYTTERALYDLNIMKDNYNKGFNEYFFHQAAMPHTRDEKRDYIFTEKMKDDIEDYAKWYNIPGLTADILMYVPPKNWPVYRTYWREMCKHDFRPLLAKIDVPTGIFYADPGSIYDVETAKYLNCNIKNSKLYPIKDAVHTSLITYSTKETFEQLLYFTNDFK